MHQARSLAFLAQKHGCITQVSFQRRSSRCSSSFEDACLERGPITHARREFYKCNPEPFLGARDHMYDDGVHAIDTLRWICGGEVTEIQSVTRRVLTPDVNFFAALLHFDNGATGVLLNSWTSGRRIFRVQMHAPGICAEADTKPPASSTRTETSPARGTTPGPPPAATSLLVFGGFQAKNRDSSMPSAGGSSRLRTSATR